MLHVPAPLLPSDALRVAERSDPREAEADRVADALVGGGAIPSVTLSTVPVVQRKCAACEEDELLRAPLPDEEDEVMASAAGPTAPTVSRAAVRGLGAGRPLGRVGEAFGAALGHDLGAVRVHDGPRAARLASEARARAFTWRHHVVFGAGEFRPDTREGQHLLAHELTHVVQQGGT